MSSVTIRKKYFSDDPEQQEINESWLEFFRENIEEGSECLITQNLIAPDSFLYSDSENSCTIEEIETYSRLLKSESPSELKITYNKQKYTFILKFDDLQDDKYPLFFFVAKDEVSKKDNEKIILLIKFVSDEIIFVGKSCKTMKSAAIKFIKENYKYDDDPESD